MKKYLGLAALGLIAVTVVAPTFAKEQLERKDHFTKPEISQYMNTVAKEVTKGNLTVKVADMLLDNANRNLTVITEVTGKQAIESFEGGDFGIFEDVCIDGEWLNTGSTGSYAQLDDHTARVIMTYPLEKSYQGDVAVDYKIKQIEWNGAMNLNRWHFETTVNGDQLANETQVVKLNEKVNLPNGAKMTIAKYTSNVLGQKIYYTTTDDLLNQYNLEVRGSDQEGNAVTFEFAGGNTGEGGVLEAHMPEGQQAVDMTKMTFEVYAQAMPKEEGPITAAFEKVGESFTLNGK